MFKKGDENALAMLNASKVRYEVLNQEFYEITDMKINVVVDLYKLFDGFRHDYLKAYSDAIIKNKLCHNLAAEILNWVGHYNRYFERRSCGVTFYLLYGHRDDFFPEHPYLEKYKVSEKFLTHVVESRLRHLCDLTSNIHVVNTNEPATTGNVDRSAFFFAKKLKGYTFVITDDLIMTQVVTMRKKTFIVKVRNDNCNILTAREGILNSFGKDYKNGYLYNINDKFLPVYITLIGEKKLFHEKLKKKAILDVLNELDNFDLTKNPYDYFKSKIKGGLSEDEIDSFNKNFKEIYNMVNFSRFNQTKESILTAIEMQTWENNTDKELLATVNEKHFGGSIRLDLL